MNSNKEMIARLIKEKRQAMGLTQKELACLTQLSERSIQRIESAALVPRSYTLRQIAEVLSIPFESFVEKNGRVQEHSHHVLAKGVSREQKLILSIFIPLLTILLAAAFLQQASGFPETAFEFFIFWGFVTGGLTGYLFILWKPSAHKQFL